MTKTSFNFMALSTLLLTLFNGGCASLTDRRQYLRVVPPTPDSEIVYDGEIVGQGPSTIRIEREYQPKISFKKGSDSVDKPLDTYYRWGHSFGSNAFLISLAPIGWATDIVTGAAWESRNILAHGKKFELNEKSKVLILPPMGFNSVESKQLGLQIETLLKEKYPKVDILDFEKNYDHLLGMGFDHESSTLDRDKNSFAEIVYDTKATHLVFTEYNEESNSAQIKVYSPYSEKIVAEQKIDNLTLDKSKSVSWLYSEFFEAFPNTISLGIQDTTYSGCAFNQTQGAYKYCAYQQVESPLNIISSLSVTNILHYRKRRPWRVYLRFYPDFNISYNQIRFEKAAQNLADIGIEWVFFNIGYGPRFSFVIPVGELFMEVTPNYSLNYIKLYSDNFSETKWIGEFAFSAQVGFNTWIANHWNLRFYVKSYAAEVIYSDLSRVDPGTTFDGYLGITQTGLYVGYYFHEEKSKLFKLLF